MGRPRRVSNRTQSKASAAEALQSHYKSLSTLHLRQLFADDPQRGERMAVEAAGIYLDYSKNRITDETLTSLFQLAAERGLQSRIDAMFRGEKINITENRASEPALGHDGSANNLLRRYRKLREEDWHE